MYFSEPDETICHEIVDYIQENDPRGAEHLYQHCSGAIRHLLHRLLSTEDVEERLHDVLMSVILAIQKGKLREPSRLPAYVRTVARRFAIATFRAQIERQRLEVHGVSIENVDHPSDNNLEQECIRRQSVKIARETLNSLGQNYRDVLYRFYILEQAPEIIQLEMGLTADQFRVMKNRAKNRFTVSFRKACVTATNPHC